MWPYWWNVCNCNTKHALPTADGLYQQRKFPITLTWSPLHVCLTYSVIFCRNLVRKTLFSDLLLAGRAFMSLVGPEGEAFYFYWSHLLFQWQRLMQVRRKALCVSCYHLVLWRKLNLEYVPMWGSRCFTATQMVSVQKLTLNFSQYHHIRSRLRLRIILKSAN